MKKLLLICCLWPLTGCAFYMIEATTPDGVSVKGTALVANNSREVALNVEHGDFKASFGKSSTDGTPQLDALTQAIRAALNPIAPVQ